MEYNLRCNMDYKHTYETILCDLTTEQIRTVRANIRLLADDTTLTKDQVRAIALGILSEV
jgi:hypothetical protein